MNVSVVVPAFNEEKYLKRCLKSLEDQLEKASEIIVVDNNCTDSTIEIAKKFNVKIIKEKKQGISFARNAGFNAAKYDIIARTDSDAILPKNWISKIKQNFKDSRLGALSGPTYYHSRWSKSTNMAHLPSLMVFDTLGLLFGNGCLYGPNMAIRKVFWKKVRKETCLDNKKVHEDIDLSIHLNKITKIKFDSKLIVGTTRMRWQQIGTEYIVRLIKMLASHRKMYSS